MEVYEILQASFALILLIGIIAINNRNDKKFLKKNKPTDLSKC